MAGLSAGTFLKGRAPPAPFSAGDAAVPESTSPAAHAQGDGVVVVATGETINSLRLAPHRHQPAELQIAVNCYDRLVSFGHQRPCRTEPLYDYSVIRPDLAEELEPSARTALRMTFALRREAVFQTERHSRARNVKWCSTRAVSVGGFPTRQMRRRRLRATDQFDRRGRAHLRSSFLDRPTKLALPNLACPSLRPSTRRGGRPYVTEADPWATEVRPHALRNTIGSGAYQGDPLGTRRSSSSYECERRLDERAIFRGVPPCASLREVPSKRHAARLNRSAGDDADVLPHSRQGRRPSLADDGQGTVGFPSPIENCIYCVRRQQRLRSRSKDPRREKGARLRHPL